MYLGQNTLTALTPAEMNFAAGVDAASVQSIFPGGDFPPPPPDCPPFDCSQCPVKTVTVKEKVLVPGPTQIVYQDRYITQPGGSSQQWGMPTVSPDQIYGGLPIVRIPAAPSTTPVAPPEDFEMSEGVVEVHEKRKFPWLWLVLGGGAAYLMMKKK